MLQPACTVETPVSKNGATALPTMPLLVKVIVCVSVAMAPPV